HICRIAPFCWKKILPALSGDILSYFLHFAISISERDYGNLKSSLRLNLSDANFLCALECIMQEQRITKKFVDTSTKKIPAVLTGTF
ncbi:MAG: hypothetical protein IKN27_10365, partial [Selenomonadaceae bacterium]|nr:hypothetical protein [Selenomonadaceae bacterium]